MSDDLHFSRSGTTHFGKLTGEVKTRLQEPMHTVTTRDRFALVTVAGEQYAIADIGLRMLSPRELFRDEKAWRSTA